MAQARSSLSTTHDWYAERLADIINRPSPREADVSANLVRPVLEKVLEFDFSEIDEQPSEKTNIGGIYRPDFVCRKKGTKAATLIVEVKNIGIDLLKRTPNGPWASSPIGKLQFYLYQFRQSQNGTWGAVTNGTQWIITQREGEHIPFYKDIEPPIEISTLKEVREALQPINDELQIVDEDWFSETDLDWLDVLANELCNSPTEFVSRISPPPHTLCDARDPD